MKISLAMIVKNEGKYIERCLNSVKELVDEIVIVDTGSTDNTISRIKQFPNIKLFEFEWCDDFSIARNYSIEKTTGDYILVLDADEYVEVGTRDELEKVMRRSAIGRILIESRFRKENQVHIAKSHISRFFERNTRYVGAIHEQLDSNKIRIDMSMKVKHDGYFEVNKSERNIPLLFKEVSRNPTDPYYLFQLGKELRISERYKESFSILEKAYNLSNVNAPFYGELVVELINSGKEYGENKIFEFINQNEKLLENLCDFHFAKGLFYLDISIKSPTIAVSYIHKIESSFLKCLRLDETKKIEYLQGTGSFLAAYNLGIFYEVTGNLERAKFYFELSSQYDYLLAKERIQKFI
ncbi:glycosyltransferase family 2 protein [Lysinibacillus endophyticus]|uniref:glycosyltransferase family 2 protein n=1 Tax=Ureibacillus endophyticus TaxID=1978490 RepID=UPI003135E34D